MGDIAVCTTVFKRIERLNTLLHSIDPNFISTVYVADNGKLSNRKEEVYSQSFPFDLVVFDLEFNAGLGASRHRVIQEFDEEYLLLMDSDMQMPENTHVLLEQLKADSGLGGVCGVLAEEKRIFSSGCLDIYEEDDECEIGMKEQKQIKLLANYPFVEFDMIANAALFRRECLEDYNWDPEYNIGREHVDFYIGHKRHTDWKFGLCPSVLFPHDPGGSEDYLSYRWNDDEYERGKRYLLQKHNLKKYEQTELNWMDVYDPRFKKYSNPNLLEKAKDKCKSDGMFSTCRSGLRFVARKII